MLSSPHNRIGELKESDKADGNQDLDLSADIDMGLRPTNHHTFKGNIFSLG